MPSRSAIKLSPPTLLRNEQMLCAFVSQTDYLLPDTEFPFYLLHYFHQCILKVALSGICSSSTEKMPLCAE